MAEYDPHDNTGYDNDGDDYDDLTPEEQQKWREYWESGQAQRDMDAADKYKATVSKKTYERWKSEEEEGRKPTWDYYEVDGRGKMKKQGLPGEKIAMKDRNPSIKTSTSKGETSFGGEPSLEKRIQERERTDAEILEVYPNIDKRWMPRITQDTNGQLIYKGIQKWKDGIDHNKPHIIAVGGRPSIEYFKKDGLPSGLKKALGMSNVEINDENYTRQRKEEDKQAKREANLEKLRSDRLEINGNLEDSRAKLVDYGNTLEEYEKILRGHPTVQEAKAVRKDLTRIKELMGVERERM